MTQLTHLGRAIDLSVPSNRQIVALATGALATYIAGAIRRDEPTEEETACLELIGRGQGGPYGQLARWLPFSEPDDHIRLLRIASALASSLTVFSTWSLAREVLPDQPALATIAAALIAAQPSVVAGARRVNLTTIQRLAAVGTLTLITRIASRSTGKPPTALDIGAVTAVTGVAALLDTGLHALLPTLALAVGYDARRDGAWSAGARRAALPALATVALAAADALDRLPDAPHASTAASDQFADRLIAILGGLGAAIGLLAQRHERLRSRADDGSRLSRDAVQFARWLTVGWTALRLAQRHGHPAGVALAPLSIGLVGGAATLGRLARQRT